MRVLSLFILLSLLGVGSSQCTASTLIVTGSTTYDCAIDLSHEVTLHWNRETGGGVAFAATTTSVNGWFSVSFPYRSFSMIPAIGVASTSATAAGSFSFNERSAAGITSVVSPLFNNPTTEIVNGMRILRFNVEAGFLSTGMPVNYAFHSYEMDFPVSKHTSVRSVIVDFVVPLPPVPINFVTCRTSNLIVAGTTYDCVADLSPEVSIHWNRGTVFGPTEFVATTTSVNGWFSVSFPLSLGSMIPAIGVASTSATTADIISITGRSAAGITSVVSPLFSNPTTEIVNGMRILKFNIESSFRNFLSTINYAFHSSEMRFPVSKHTSVGSLSVSFIGVQPGRQPAPAPTCRASTLVLRKTTTYDCMTDLSPEVSVHWNSGAFFGTTDFAATTSSVNGWFSVSFPNTLGSMFPALGVASTSATAADIFSFTERTAAGITSDMVPLSNTPTNPTETPTSDSPSLPPSASQFFENPTTEITNGMRILRFNIASHLLLRPGTPVNFAYHSSEMDFPVSKHTTVGSVSVDFVEPLPASLPPTTLPPTTLPPTTTTLPPTTLPPASLPPTTLPPTPVVPPPTVVSSPAVGTVRFEVVAELSDLVSQIDTLVAAASTSLGGTARCSMLCQGTNCVNCDGTVVNQRSVSTLVRASWRVVLIIINNENGSITKTAVDNSLKNLLSNNAVIGYFDGSVAVVAAAANSNNPQVVVVNNDFDDAHTHGRIMVAIWAYWVPLSVVVKVLGPFVCKREVFRLPISVFIHVVMMIMAMCLTTVFASIALSDFNSRVDYGHRVLGIALLVIGWVQILSSLVKPDKEFEYGKYWGWGHVLFGISVVVISIAQMATGVEIRTTLFLSLSLSLFLFSSC